MKLLRSLIALSLALSAGGLSAAGAADKAKPAEKRTSKSAPAAGSETGRDWTRIDTNKDGFVSPDEMEAWLKANPGPQK